MKKPRPTGSKSHYEVRTIDAHGDATDVEVYETLEAAVCYAKSDYITSPAVVVEHVLCTYYGHGDAETLDREHDTVYEAGSAFALAAWRGESPDSLAAKASALDALVEAMEVSVNDMRAVLAFARDGKAYSVETVQEWLAASRAALTAAKAAQVSK